jgi:hypothetical protein
MNVDCRIGFGFVLLTTFILLNYTRKNTLRLGVRGVEWESEEWVKVEKSLSEWKKRGKGSQRKEGDVEKGNENVEDFLF